MKMGREEEFFINQLGVPFGVQGARSPNGKWWNEMSEARGSE